MNFILSLTTLRFAFLFVGLCVFVTVHLILVFLHVVCCVLSVTNEENEDDEEDAKGVV